MTQVVKEHATKALLACTGPIRLGIVDGSDEHPVAQFIVTAEELKDWNAGTPL